MSKTPVRQMLIDDFKKAGAKPIPYVPANKQIVANVKAGRTAVFKKTITVIKHPKEVRVPVKLNPKARARTTVPITSLAEQYIQARKDNDDLLADYIFLQISHLD